MPSHGDATSDLNTVLVIDDAVQNTFSNGTAFSPVTGNAVIPVIYIILGAEEQCVFLPAYIEQFQKIIDFRLRERPEMPFINEQQVKLSIDLFYLMYSRFWQPHIHSINQSYG